jgi:hypothetical protein
VTTLSALLTQPVPAPVAAETIGGTIGISQVASVIG